MVFGKKHPEDDSPEVEYVDKGIANFAEIAHVGESTITLQQLLPHNISFSSIARDHTSNAESQQNLIHTSGCCRALFARGAQPMEQSHRRPAHFTINTTQTART